MSLAAYVHFPWCVRKCPYCDFNSHPLTGSLDEHTYVEALLTDLAHQRSSLPDRAISTVFYGGGTPSLFGAAAFERLNRALACAGEITMEANPGTTEHADFAAYRDTGVNRLSIGAQSFDDKALAKLGRIHAASDTETAFRAARTGGFDNINVDVMYALPGQRVEGALADLTTAIALAPEHISWYQLTIEPKTAFHQNPPTLPDDDLVADMETAGHALLRAHGFERYEVSAWAKPGRQCQHNLNYWRFGDYLGVGAGAHGKQGYTRTQKAKAPSRYLADPQALAERSLEPGERPFECLMNALRLPDGISWSHFEEVTGCVGYSRENAWLGALTSGLVREDRAATTELGYQHLDTVLSRLLPSG